jgi:predicted CopG family antitoxin
MAIPTFIWTLRDAGIVQLYQISYRSKTGGIRPIFLIPVYRFPTTVDEAELLKLARPIIDTLAQLLQVCLSDEVDRTIVAITEWKKRGKGTLEYLEQVSIIPRLGQIKKGFRAFSELLEDYVYSRGLGDILEENIANVINDNIDELKPIIEEAKQTLKPALVNVETLIKKLSTKSPVIITEFSRATLRKYRKNYQTNYAPYLEDWIFKYGKIDPAPYVHSDPASSSRILFTIRDGYFDPIGVYFTLSLQEIAEVRDSKLLDYTKLGWIGDLGLSEADLPKMD